MEFVDKQPSQDGGSLAISYTCPSCKRGISMITNAGETQVVRSLGVTIGHETLDGASPAPMTMIRGALAAQAPTRTAQSGPDPVWTDAALKRLTAAPTFVQGMIRHLYTDYARRQGYTEITPAVMSEARQALGMTEM
jgi:hypothetical protein